MNRLNPEERIRAIVLEPDEIPFKSIPDGILMRVIDHIREAEEVAREELQEEIIQSINDINKEETIEMLVQALANAPDWYPQPVNNGEWPDHAHYKLIELLLNVLADAGFGLIQKLNEEGENIK